MSTFLMGCSCCARAGGRGFGSATLWVADASVMATIPSGNTNLGTVMVAERIARTMLETDAG
ncbi:MAG: GMC oxidoreductase [Actinomycetota bacterium]